jgi:hypothetical protein
MSHKVQSCSTLPVKVCVLKNVHVRQLVKGGGDTNPRPRWIVVYTDYTVQHIYYNERMRRTYQPKVFKGKIQRFGDGIYVNISASPCKFESGGGEDGKPALYSKDQL